MSRVSTDTGFRDPQVRDDELYLFLRIRRSPRGDVYVMIPLESPEERKLWNPHASYHASGDLHQKSYDRKFVPRRGQKPYSMFQEVACIMTRPIATDEPRAFKVHCMAKEFTDVFEIPVHELHPEKYYTAIEVDLSGPGGLPIIPVNAMSENQIIRQKIFRDTVPWIVVTLYNMWPVITESSYAYQP